MLTYITFSLVIRYSEAYQKDPAFWGGAVRPGSLATRGLTDRVA